MTRTRVFSLFILILLLAVSSCQHEVQKTPVPTATSSPVSTTAVPLTPTPTVFQPPRYPDHFTWEGELIRIAWFYKPPENGDLAAVAENFDFFILTRKDEEARERLRDLGVSQPILQYVRLDAIMDPGDCETSPWGNQVAFLPGDYCRLSEQHPEWFLTDQGGNRIRDDENFVYMDPGAQGWREFWLERVRASQQELGWYGVFLDNVEASLEKHEDRELTHYPDQASFQDAVEGFLDYLQREYFEPEQRPLYGNIISLEDDRIWYRYLQYLDGAMNEAWAVGWRDRYRSPEDWEKQIKLAEESQRRGKDVILVAQGAREDLSRQRFAFASYLLISDGLASFRYSRANFHQQIWWYENYDLDLGVPLGPCYQLSSLWLRDFSRGQVVVNPENYQAEIIITGDED